MGDRASNSDNLPKSKAELDKAPQDKTANLLRDAAMPLLLDAFQRPVVNKNIYKDAVVDLEEKANRMFSQVSDPALKADLIKYQMQVDDAIMHHQPCPLKSDNPIRRGIAAHTLADGKDAECGVLNQLVGIQYLPDVLRREGRLLDPNNPAEQQQWLNETQLLAKIGSFLDKDDNALLHPEQIDRYNPNPKFRPLDEPLPPPDDFNHHLPTEFSTKLFLDNDGKPRIFNPRELREKELTGILQGELMPRVDPQEQAVLALHKEVLAQELPWWTLADNKLVKGNDQFVNGAEEFRNNILNIYAQDFNRFQNQLAAIQNQPGWDEYQRRAMAEIPSTAQARHFVTAAEAAALTPDQKKERCWDTRNQTDAELTRETVRRAEWQHLVALQKAVGNGLLFPQAQVPIREAELPSALSTHLRAIRSGTNVNQFRNPAISEDLARRWATKQLRREFGQPIADPSIFGESVTRPDGTVAKVATDAQINKWEKDNRKQWDEHGYPWTLHYVYNTNINERVNRGRRDALERFPVLDCANSNEAREGYVGVKNNMVNLVSPTGRRQQQNVDALMRNPQAVCPMHEYDTSRDPFKNYNPVNDPLLEILQSTVKRQ